ncbi:MAG: antibiotic biosynthesis monooxygenase [Cytophagales bacterium]|nr:antibiotic biosynthesis monooxygenase [Armatimonadota bacterium]
MYVVCVTVLVTPGNGERFAESARKNHEGTRQEPGNLRFDVLRAAAPPAPGDPEPFFLYEVYRTKDDFASHQQTPHYQVFRDEVAGIMATPRQGVHYQSLFPEPWKEDA